MIQMNGKVQNQFQQQEWQQQSIVKLETFNSLIGLSDKQILKEMLQSFTVLQNIQTQLQNP